MKEGTTAFEAGSEFYQKHIDKDEKELINTSLDDDPFQYIELLDRLELNKIKLRQLQRRHNMGFLK